MPDDERRNHDPRPDLPHRFAERVILGEVMRETREAADAFERRARDRDRLAR
jgi:hypothetical protein